MPTLPPDTSMTFRDIILRVAEECSLASYDPSDADSPADIPQDRQVLDKIKRAVNDGLDRMGRAYPKWTALRPQVRFTMSVDGTGPLSLKNSAGVADPSLYRLPWYITGQPVNGWQWASTESNFAGAAANADPERVDRMHRSVPATSYPQLAAIVPCGPLGAGGSDGSERQTRAVRFWPSPDQAYEVSARFLVYPPKMTNLSDRHIFGASHDQTVISFAVWSFKEHDAKDPSMRATYQARADRALAESVRIDQEAVPASLGLMTDPGIEGMSRPFINPGCDVLTTSMESVL